MKKDTMPQQKNSLLSFFKKDEPASTPSAAAQLIKELEQQPELLTSEDFFLTSSERTSGANAKKKNSESSTAAKECEKQQHVKKQLVQARIMPNNANGFVSEPVPLVSASKSETSKGKKGQLTEEEKEQLKIQRAALMRAQELMRETELPEDVELQSDIEEQEPLSPKTQERIKELKESPFSDQECQEVDEEETAPYKRLDEFIDLLEREVGGGSQDL